MRKIIQIAFEVSSEGGQDPIGCNKYALCDDGSVWEYKYMGLLDNQYVYRWIRDEDFNEIPKE